MNLYRGVFVAVSLLVLTPSVVLTQELIATKVVGIEYPGLAIAARIHRTVKIKCILTAEGTVVSTEILEAIADVEGPALREVRSKGVRDMLGKAAQENALKWTFSVPDKSVSPSTVLTYRFIFEEGANYGRSRYVFEYPATIRVIAELGTPQI